MKIYQVPAGYPSFEAVESVFKAKLPENFKIIESKAGGKMPMFTAGKMVGTIKIRQNSYNGMIVTLTSTDGNINDNISINDYTPSSVIGFLQSKVLGYVTNLIFPAIYGTSSKIYTAVDDIIMKNFQANEMDISMKTSMKNMFKGQGMTQVKNTSIGNITDSIKTGINDTIDSSVENAKDSVKDELGV